MNAHDVLKYGNLTLLKTIEGLPEADWMAGGVCGWWSVKDIVAHLTSFEHVLVEVLSFFLGGGPTPTLDQYTSLNGDQFNQVQVSLRQDKSPAEVLSEYHDRQACTMTLVARIPPETLRLPGTIPWYGMEYSLDDFITYAYYGHKREHSAQIASFRDQIKR
jgi:hypothetical protein